MHKQTSLILTIWIAVVLAASVRAQDSSAQTANARVVRLLIFDVNPNSISPASITVEQGFYLIRIRNAVTLSELPVVLDHEATPNVMQAVISRRRPSLQRVVMLGPGRHTLRVGNRTAWRATINVRASEER